MQDIALRFSRGLGAGDAALAVHSVRVRPTGVWGRVGPWSDEWWVTVTAWFEDGPDLFGWSQSTSDDLDSR